MKTIIGFTTDDSAPETVEAVRSIVGRILDLTPGMCQVAFSSYYDGEGEGWLGLEFDDGEKDEDTAFILNLILDILPFMVDNVNTTEV